MRILMLGAGAVGGYFGARIHQAGGDITFLVRPARAQCLAGNGLQIFSSLGDVHIAPKILTPSPNSTAEKFDTVILSCKAYDLDAAIETIMPVLDAEGVVVPLLNGLAHLDLLDTHFGRERVLGGFAHLGVTLAASGEIRHLNDLQRLVIGCRTPWVSPLVHSLSEILASSGIDFSLSENIESEMWDKFIFLATIAGATCTMRCPLGDLLKTRSGKEFILGLLDECITVANKSGHMPNPEHLDDYRIILTMPDSKNTASMLRDVEQRRKTEADHILGDMIHRAELQSVNTPLLKIAYSHLQSYEIRRAREGM